jgi:hypothetical protein
MAIQYVILSREPSNLGKEAVKILMKDGNAVRMAEITIRAGDDPEATLNLPDLWQRGVEPPALLSPRAVFQAAKDKPHKAVHLGAIYMAFQSLKTGGDAAQMIAQARLAYAQSDDKLAEMNAFVEAFKAATATQQAELMAIGIYAVGSLIGMDIRK